MSSCETIFNLANTMMGSGSGTDYSHISIERVDPLKKHPEVFGVFTFFLNKIKLF